MKLVVVFFCLFIVAVACQSTPKNPNPENIRHGWTIFTGPKRTIVGVNDQSSIKRGEKVFKSHCVGCHGESGKGDGPVAKIFDIQPANLKALSGKFPNYYLLIQISEGGGAMPKWRDLLTTEEAWDLTNYIQAMGKKAGQ